MIQPNEIATIVKSVVSVARQYIDSIAVAFNEKIKALEERMAAIPAGAKGDAGERGERGEDGKPGEMGPIGPKGIDGKDGSPGLSIKGDPGERGADGKDGRDGRDGIGKDGRDGAAGKDALEIDILPSIKAGTSYPRGTYAKHQGGLLRSIRATTPAESIDLSEWDVIFDAWLSPNCAQGADFRSFRMEWNSLGGQKAAFNFRMPVLLYRGIFKNYERYVAGDVVTYGGSAWHCERDDTSATPGTSTDWKLMVKEGRPGKDGKGEKGDKGDSGRDGKDGKTYYA